MPSRVLIGVQARSTSTRFPRKVFEKIGDKTMLDHVMDACRNAARYVTKNDYTRKMQVEVGLLVPFGDEIVKTHGSRFDIVEGPENDVLTRYVLAAAHFKSDYIVRITSDCPLMKDSLITKVINCGVFNSMDYVSNVTDQNRTAVDGFDVEIISAKLLRWADTEAKKQHDREHVTTFIRSDRPRWARMGRIVHELDLSFLKYSVDTKEDLERVRDQYSKVQAAIADAENRGETVFRY